MKSKTIIIRAKAERNHTGFRRDGFFFPSSPEGLELREDQITPGVRAEIDSGRLVILEPDTEPSGETDPEIPPTDVLTSPENEDAIPGLVAAEAAPGKEGKPKR